MTEDQEFELLERRLQREKERQAGDLFTRAQIAAAEFVSTQSADLLAITTLRKAFEYGYRVGWRDASKENK